MRVNKEWIGADVNLGSSSDHATALIEHWGLLREPLTYLGGYLKRHQAEYYRRLSAVRSDGDWEGWVSFFLEGVAAASADAERSIIEVASLITADRKRLLESPKTGPISYRLFKLLEELGVVAELTGQKKNRVYGYAAYVTLLSR